jgi:DNA-binding MarR family transcriptional regulator
VLDFMRLLWRIEHELQAASKRMQQHLGITGPQRLVLRLVDEYPGIAPGEVAKLLHLHPSTVTGVIQRLIAKRLLRRDRDERDTRRFHLQTCRPAKRYTRASAGLVERAIAGVLRGASDAQVRSARALLGSLAEALDGSGGPA